MRRHRLDTGAPLVDSAVVVVVGVGGGGTAVDATGDDGILGAHHLGPVARFLGALEGDLGDGVPVGGEDVRIPLTVLFVEDGIVVSFLGDLAFLDELRIDEILEATDADALGGRAVHSGLCDVVDDVELVALVVLIVGEAGLAFTIGIFAEGLDKVHLRPAVEVDLARTARTRRHRKQVGRRGKR